MGPRIVVIVLTAALAMSGCGRDSDTPPASPPEGAATPVAAVRDLTRHLVANDLAAFAREAVPHDLHARLDSAWRQGQTRWPLDEFPLADRHPAALAALAADVAPDALQRSFDRQFANAATELKQTAAALGLFGVQYVEQQGNFSAAQRQHYAQVVTALSAWGMRAPLSNRAHAAEAIGLLTEAARTARLNSAEDFASAGMDDALRRMAPVLAAGKQALALYGLDLDADLSAMQVHLQSQTGETAKVRMEYSLAGTAIDTVVDVERRAGRWYVSDFVADAEAAVIHLDAADAGQ